METRSSNCSLELLKYSTKSFYCDCNSHLANFDDASAKIRFKKKFSTVVAPLLRKKNHNNKTNIHNYAFSIFIALIQVSIGFVLLGIAMTIIFYYNQQKNYAKMIFKRTTKDAATIIDEASLCSKTCKIEIVESVSQNLTFLDEPMSMSTLDAWLKLIRGAKYRLSIAAYKSSLRGKHVLGNVNQQFSSQGELIYDAIAEAGLKRHVAIRVVENSPSKDKGDNEDAVHLHKIGAITRKTLNLQNIYNTGVMHSKFIVADSRHFYLGSANLDWRSLNQKMELGVYVSNCPCMAKDLTSLFDLYWRAADAKSTGELVKILNQQTTVQYNSTKPLRIKSQEENAEIYLASSPRFMNAPSRNWDLDSIVSAISTAKLFVNIHVMDYIPMFMYGKDKKFWPTIDNAIRSAIMRGVDVNIIAAALHSPNISLRFLESLESLKKMPGAGIVNVRIFKVPSAINLNTVIKRDRRTHKKFLVTDSQVIIGTSNWSGDYFDAKGTGAAIVIRRSNLQKANVLTPNIIKKMHMIFDKDWKSAYAHPLAEYIRNCLEENVSLASKTNFNNHIENTKSFMCEPKKDSSLFARSVIKAQI